MNRYAKATAAEKAIFTQLNKVLAANTDFKVANRELKGEKSRVKFIFNLKKNNPHIHSLEFGTKNGEVTNIRLVVARTCKGSDFYKAVQKGQNGAKDSYGGIVLHFDADATSAPKTLELISKAADASEVIELNPTRTYCDPPANWIDGNDGRQGVVKKEAKKAVPEVEAPKAQEESLEEPSAEDVAKEDMAA